MARERPDLKQYVGRKLTVIAWLWARTVKSPNPAFADVDVPLASTFVLSTKKGKGAYVEPVIENERLPVHGQGGKTLLTSEAAAGGTKLARGENFQCLFVWSTPVAGTSTSMTKPITGRMGERLMAVVVEGDRQPGIP